MYKLLALDMDGTLLTDRKTISQNVKKSIRDVIDSKRANVTIATGRFPASAWLHGKELGISVPLVSLNGAVLLHPETGEEVKGFPLSKDIAKKINAFAKEKNVYIHYHGYNVLYVENKNNMNQSWAMANVVVDETKEFIEENYIDQINHFKIEAVRSFHDFLKQDECPALYKATLLNDNPVLVEELYQEMVKWPELTITRTGPHRFDINTAGVSKKASLEILCKMLGLTREEVIVAGDYDNDAEMISWAGLGVAMGNGNDYIKEIADEITKSNEEDGVAEIIKKYFQ